MSLTLEQIKLLLNSGKKQVAGFTASELAAESGVARRTAQRRIKDRLADGTIRRIVDRVNKSTNGRTCYEPAYEFVEADGD